MTIVADQALFPNCRICGSESEFFDEGIVLRKHPVKYFRCTHCGFIQTETPYWLDEAYSSAIARQDVGIMQRNLLNRELTCGLLHLMQPGVRRCVDFGAGHGMFVRLMRDRGFDFRWYDRHASNDYARGFEYQEGELCEFLTAFEVLEHLVDPVNDLLAAMQISENLFVSTMLVPQPVPKLSDWWYFLPSTGQHVSFYTHGSLEILARRFGRHLLSHGPYHLFTKKPASSYRFRLAMSYRAATMLNKLYRRPSMVEADFRLMAE